MYTVCCGMAWGRQRRDEKSDLCETRLNLSWKYQNVLISQVVVFRNMNATCTLYFLVHLLAELGDNRC